MTIDLRYGDTIEQMKLIPDKSIDFICCDLPYGSTKNHWDIVIPFEQLWEQYKRIIKDDGAIALFGTGLFAYKLALSNEKMYKYEIIWHKSRDFSGYSDGDQNRIVRTKGGMMGTDGDLELSQFPNGIFHFKLFFNKQNKARLYYRSTRKEGRLKFISWRSKK
jgi:hypothetical protein